VSLPSLIRPVVEAGSLAGREQPSLTVDVGLHIDGWHDMHLHARLRKD